MNLSYTPPIHSIKTLDRLSRRQVLCWALATTAAIQTVSGRAASPSSRRLQQPIGIAQLETRTKVELEVDGQLRIKSKPADARQEASSAELKAKASHDFYEIVAFQRNQQSAAARKYLTAKLENWVAGKEIRHSLRTDCDQIRVLERDGVWEQYCPDQPLERREVELLRTPINTMMLERLLPLEPARTDSQWTVSEDDARHLFNLDAVFRSNLSVKVLSIEKGMVKLEIHGTVEGTANSVPTQLNIRGSAHAGLGSQCAMVQWLGVSIQEHRDISHMEPGYSVTARLQVLRREEPGKVPVEANELLDLAKSDDPTRWLVRLESQQGRFATYVDRKWFTYVDGGEDSVLRMVENNQVLAQCNLARLPNLAAGSQLTLEGMQADIRKALGERFGEIVESTEKVTSNQLRLLRTEVSGTQEQIPLRWIYAHLSDDSGRRIALVYTMEASQAEKIADSELQMLDSIQFLATPVEPSTSEPAQVSANPLQPASR